MPKPELDDAEIDAGLEQMGGPGVTQGVHTGLLGHPGCEAGLLKGSAHTYNADRCRSGMRIHPGAGSGGKQPDRIAMGAPLAAKQGKGARGQRNVTILEALAAT